MSKLFSDFENTLPEEPLVSLEDAKFWFGVTDASVDLYLTAALEAVSGLVRDYTGRYLLESAFRETWRSREAEPFTYGVPVNLREYPLKSITSGATIDNRAMGRVLPESDVVEYVAGYTALPATLKVVFFELVRQQMYVFGYETFGTSSPIQATAARSVSIGNLKVDFGAPAGAASAPINLAKGAGGLTKDALIPYEELLNAYRSNYAMVAT